MVTTYKNVRFKIKINGILNNKKYEYNSHFNNKHMKQSSKMNQRELSLCDLNLFNQILQLKDKHLVVLSKQEAFPIREIAIL